MIIIFIKENKAKNDVFLQFCLKATQKPKKNMKKLLIIFTIAISLFACKKNDNQNSDLHFSTYAEGNIFNDSTILNIAKLQYKRNSLTLIKKTKSDYEKNTKYLKFVLQAFASIQDTNAIDFLASYLNHKDAEIRTVAAFSLGQTAHSQAESYLLKSYINENDVNVKSEIIIAVGKCGTYSGLDFIIGEGLKDENKILSAAKIKAMAKFAERQYLSGKLIDEAANLLSDKTVSKEIQYWCSYYLYRAGSDLTIYRKALITTYYNSNDIYTKDNIIKSLAKIATPDVLSFLSETASNEENDYRLRISAIKSLGIFDYYESEKLFRSLLSNKNTHIAISASEFYIKKGVSNKSEEYYELAKSTENRHVRTNMLTAALKFSKEKDKISMAIKSGIEATDNLYEKGKLIEALSYDISTYEYLEEIAFNSERKVLSTAAINALANMRYSKDFEKFAITINKEKNTNIEIEFAEIFKKAILSGDIALMSVAAGVIRDENFNYRTLYDNTYFITQAIDNCILPNDIEAYQELIKTDNFINGTKREFKIENIQYKKPNFDFIKRIKPDQKVKFVTTKGEFIMQLNVNEAPVSVSSFLELVQSKFYEGKSFHRVVQNFVIQDGCPRGDGWGGPGYAIKSEFSQSQYNEASVGLASAGKDTESSQWFVTHTRTPHLDGKYTIIATVVEGKNTIHEIQIGDTIISVEIL